MTQSQPTQIQRAACLSMGTKQCAPICLSHLPFHDYCPEACKVWTKEAIEREEKRRPNGPLSDFPL